MITPPSRRPPATPEQTRAFEARHTPQYPQVLTHRPHLLPSRACTFASLAELKHRVQVSGNDFFTHPELRIFRGFEGGEPSAGTVFFVTSQAAREPGERVYRVWYVSAQPDGRTLLVGALRPQVDNLRTARAVVAEAQWACPPAPALRVRRRA